MKSSNDWGYLKGLKARAYTEKMIQVTHGICKQWPPFGVKRCSDICPRTSVREANSFPGKKQS